MQETILIIYLVVAIALVGIILLQQGKGAEMGASFGAGGANTVFGAAGSGNALTKATTILAILFFGIAMSISYINSSPEPVQDAIFDVVPAAEEKAIESQTPTDDQTTGVESELPPVEQAEAVENQAAEVDSAIKEATTEEDPKKDGDN